MKTSYADTPEATFSSEATVRLTTPAVCLEEIIDPLLSVAGPND